MISHTSQPGPWWRDAVIYQIYPRSFKSTSGPMGDLRGVTEKLPYIASIGVDAIWLSPFYTSPQKDAGYDVSDYRSIDPRFGTLDDADAMIARASELGLKVIIDLVPNHTSDQHEWFQAALRAGPGSPERDRYIFRDGVDGGPPNDWTSVFGGIAWTQVEDGQWYLHLFDSTQPDLNWTHQDVRDEFLSILKFWLDRGVAGFRVDVAHGLAKDMELPNWQFHWDMVGGQQIDESLIPPPPMWDRDEVHEIYREWRTVLDSYDGDRMMCGEAWVNNDQRRSLYVRDDEMNQCFNFTFLSAPWQAHTVGDAIERSLAANDSVGAPTTWVLSNHDVMRLPSRMGLSETGKGPNGLFASDAQPDFELGTRRAKAAQLLMLGLPGSAYIYNGEELGLPDHTSLPADVREDPAFFRTDGKEAGRDGCRIPLPWDSQLPGAGFSPSGDTWLPQPEGWNQFAPDLQNEDPDSYLNFIRQALAYRAKYRLGTATLSSVETDGHYLHYRSGDLDIITTFDREIPCPAGDVVMASAPITEMIGADTTVWIRAER